MCGCCNLQLLLLQQKMLLQLLLLQLILLLLLLQLLLLLLLLLLIILRLHSQDDRVDGIIDMVVDHLIHARGTRLLLLLGG